jgi:tetratricopeptide (TPR) repeat protein
METLFPMAQSRTPYRKRAWIHSWIPCAVAAALLSGCSSRDPNVKKQKYFKDGMQYLKAEKYREAAIDFENAIQIDKRFAEAHYQLAQCYLGESVWNSAYQELLLTINLQPQNADALTDLAKLLLAAGKPQEAHDRAAAALAVKPESFDAQLDLANADAALGNGDLATEEIQKAIQNAPGRSEGYLALGLIQIKLKKLTEAEASFQKAISVNPGFLPARLLLGDFYQQQGRGPEAEQQYTAAVSAAPQNPAARGALARFFLASNRKADAERTVADGKSAVGNDPRGYRMLGDYYIGIGDSQKALAEFSSLSAAHPKDLSVKRTYIQLLMLQNRTDEANTLNEQILKDNSGDLEASIIHGQILIRNSHPNEAVFALQNAVKSAPDNAVGHFYLGVAYSQTGMAQQAESEWRTAARLAPSLMDAQRVLASMAISRNDWSWLAEIGNQLIQAQPRSPLGYVYRGMERAARGDQALAEMNFSRAMELGPADPSGYIEMAQLRMIQNRPADAEMLLQQALARDPNSIDALKGLVLLDLQLKQPAKALAAVHDQIAKSPNSSEFYMLLGSLLVDAKDMSGAESALQKAAELNPNNVNAFLVLAQLYARRGAADQAIADYQLAMQKNPRDVRLHLAYGSLLEDRGNWQQAETLYQQALQIKPDDPAVANNLAYLFIQHGGDKAAAVSMARTARKGLPNLGSTADTLGWAYYYQGVFPSAVTALQAAIKESPENPTYHYHLGLAYQKTNDSAGAKQEWKRALELHPSTELAAEIHKALSENAGG